MRSPSSTPSRSQARISSCVSAKTRSILGTQAGQLRDIEEAPVIEVLAAARQYARR